MIRRMPGPVALHGGGEFLPGDEPFLRAVLEAASRPGAGDPLRIVLLPTAVARHNPDASARFGRAAFERVAAGMGRPVDVAAGFVVDAASADDRATAATIALADLIYFPGDHSPTHLPDTATWRALGEARARGAVLAGASAGAMALAPLTWTPTGVIRGLGVVPGLVVFPHADARTWGQQAVRFPLAIDAGMGILGLGERTGVISATHDDGAPTSPWQVVGEGEVRWLAPGAVEPSVVRHGGTLDLPA